MRWIQVDRTRASFPTSGTYKAWKPIVRKHCHCQCVYCATPETRFGGLRNFHVDHHRPKSKFKRLENKIVNLLYACGVCNAFKGDDWPGEPVADHSREAYPDPAQHDYNALFTIRSDFSLTGTYVASTYMVERLVLNRWQLVQERRQSALLARLEHLRRAVSPLIASAVAGSPFSRKARQILGRVYLVLGELAALGHELVNAIPYEADDLRNRN